MNRNVRTSLLLTLFVAIGLIVSACVVEMAPPAAPGAGATAETSPAETTTPTTTPEIDADTEALAATLADELGVVAGDDEGFDGINVFRLEDVASYQPLWVAHTYGIRPFDPLQNHVVALYTFAEGEWREAARLDLQCPDYLGEGSVRQAFINESDVWLEVAGGTGAHSGCFDLLRWSGDALTIAASGFNSSPFAGEVVDVDEDGQPEVVLNYTEPYVFCYACGVRLYMAELLRWNGSQLVTVLPTTLPADAPADLRELNNAAVDLADASLYKDALPLIEEALAQAPDNETVYWNAQWIRLHAENRLTLAEDSPYPLLSWIFYGDWDAAVDQVRGYAPEAIFSESTPLIVGTPAEGWEDALADYVIQFADLALGIDPDLAPAYFLRGWAAFLQDADPQAVIANVENAAALDPDDTLYTESLAFLETDGTDDGPVATPTSPAPGVPTPITVESVQFAPGATVHTLDVTLLPDEPRGFSLEISGGQSLYVTAPPQTRAFLIDDRDQPIPARQAGGAVRFDIPTTGVYILVLQGSGPQQIFLSIPPLGTDGRVPEPATVERVEFAPGTSATRIDTMLAAGAPQGYVLRLQRGQRMFVTVSEGAVDFGVLDPAGQPLTPISGQENDAAEYLIPRTGDYTLVLSGEGVASVGVEVPPLSGGGPPTIPPVPAQTILFAPGTSWADVPLSLEAGAPAVFTLDAAAGQQMILTHNLPQVDIAVFDPQEQVLVPIIQGTQRLDYVLPETGTYTLVLRGQGSGALRVAIPPR